MQKKVKNPHQFLCRNFFPFIYFHIFELFLQKILPDTFFLFPDPCYYVDRGLNIEKSRVEFFCASRGK